MSENKTAIERKKEVAERLLKHYEECAQSILKSAYERLDTLKSDIERMKTGSYFGDTASEIMYMMNEFANFERNVQSRFADAMKEAIRAEQARTIIKTLDEVDEASNFLSSEK